MRCFQCYLCLNISSLCHRSRRIYEPDNVINWVKVKGEKPSKASFIHIFWYNTESFKMKFSELYFFTYEKVIQKEDSVGQKKYKALWIKTFEINYMLLTIFWDNYYPYWDICYQDVFLSRQTMLTGSKTIALLSKSLTGKKILKYKNKIIRTNVWGEERLTKCFSNKRKKKPSLANKYSYHYWWQRTLICTLIA